MQDLVDLIPTETLDNTDDQMFRDLPGYDGVLDSEAKAAGKEVFPDFGDITSEIGRAVGTGATDLTNAVGSLSSDLGVTDEPLFKIDPLTKEPETIIGDVGAIAVQFFVPFGAAMKVAKATTWGSKLLTQGAGYTKFKAVGATDKVASTLSKAVGASAVSTVASVPVDFVAFEANDPNIARILKDNIEGQNAVIDFLATDENDSGALNRLKRALTDSAIAGPLVDTVITGLGFGVKAVGAVTAKAAKSKPVQGGLDLLDKGSKKVWDTKVGQGAVKYLDNLYQNVAEAGLGAKKFQEAGEKAGVLRDTLDEMNLLEAYRSLNATPEYQTYALRKGSFKISKDDKGGEVLERTGESFDQIIRRVEDLNPPKPLGREVNTPVQDFSELLKYTQAKNVRDFNKRSGKAASGGIPTKEIDDFFKKFNKMPAPYRNSLNKELDAYGIYNDRMLELAQTSGLIDKETVKRYKNVSHIHAYFYRVPDDEVVAGLTKQDTARVGGSKSSLNVARREISEEDIINSVTQIDDVLLNSKRGYEGLVASAMKNNFKRRLYSDVDKVAAVSKETADLFVTKLVRNKKGQLVDPKTQKQYSRISGMDGTVDEFKINGKSEYYHVKDDFLLKSIQALNPSVVSKAVLNGVRRMGVFKRAFSDMITLDPTFVAQANFIRDSLSIAVLSRTLKPGVKGFVESSKESAVGVFKGLKDVKQKGDFRKMLESGTSFDAATKSIESQGKKVRELGDFELQGASLGTRPFEASDMIARDLEGTGVKGTTDARLADQGMGKEGGKLISFKRKSFGQFVSVLESAASKFETAGRLQEYNRLIEAGANPRKAAMLSRDIAIDFANRGSSVKIRAAAATIPFFGAHVQGVARTLRALGAKKLIGKDLTKAELEEVSRVYAKLKILAIAGIGLEAYHMDADEVLDDPGVTEKYNSIPQEIKNKNWIFVMPGSYDVWKVPKPFDFALLPNAANAYFRDAYAPKEKSFLLEYLKGAAFEMGRVGDTSLIPQAIRGPAEVLMNRGAFGNPIVPGSMEGSLNTTQKRSDTRPSAIVIGDTFGFSPLQVEHIVNSFMVGLGSVVMDTVIDPLFKIGERPGEFPDKIAKYGPMETGTGPAYFFTRRLYQSGPLPFTEQQRRNYERFEELRKVKTSISNVGSLLGANDFRIEEYSRLQTDPKYELQREMYPTYDAILKATAGMNTEIKRIADMQNLNPIEKRDMIRPLLQSRNKLHVELDSVYIERTRAREAEANVPDKEPDAADEYLKSMEGR